MIQEKIKTTQCKYARFPLLSTLHHYIQRGKYCHQLMCFSSVILCASTVQALEPRILQAGNFNIIPSLQMDLLSDDNIFRNEGEETSSLIGIIAPRVDVALLDGANFYNFQAQIINGSYAATAEDDFTDWRVAGDAHMEINSRNTLDLHLSHFDAHEPRGTGLSQYRFLPDVPDRFDELDASISYQFGAIDSRGRLVFDISHYGRDYTNNTEFTDFFGYKKINLSATFFLNVLPRTDVLFQIEQGALNYDTNQAAKLIGLNRDSEERYAYIGLAWEATAQTTGTIKVGTGSKDFDAPDREDSDNPSYEVGINWAPLTYSVVDFTAGRSFGESFGFGDARETTEFDLSWQHDWSNRFSSILRTSYQDHDLIGVDLEDEFQVYSASVNYAFARWLDVRVEFRHDSRDSTQSLFGYKQNMLTLGFVASL